MIRQSVNSTDISSVGYEETARVLEIEFQNGSIYQYFGVPRNVYTELMSSSSHGKYFNRNIRDIYNCQKVSR